MDFTTPKKTWRLLAAVTLTALLSPGAFAGDDTVDSSADLGTAPAVDHGAQNPPPASGGIYGLPERLQLPQGVQPVPLPTFPEAEDPFDEAAAFPATPGYLEDLAKELEAHHAAFDAEEGAPSRQEQVVRERVISRLREGAKRVEAYLATRKWSSVDEAQDFRDRRGLRLQEEIALAEQELDDLRYQNPMKAPSARDLRRIAQAEAFLEGLRNDLWNLDAAGPSGPNGEDRVTRVVVARLQREAADEAYRSLGQIQPYLVANNLPAHGSLDASHLVLENAKEFIEIEHTGLEEEVWIYNLQDRLAAEMARLHS